MKRQKPTSQGLMKARTRPRRRQAARRLARRRSGTAGEPGRGPPRLPANRSRRSATRRPPDCFSLASICLSTSCRPFCRLLTFPDCHFARKFANVSRYADPADVIGVVCDFGFAKIFVKVVKFASGFSSFDLGGALRRRHVADPVRELREGVVVRRHVLDERPGRVLVLRVLRDADDRSVDVARAVPPSDSTASTGIGAVPYFSSGCSAAMNETRHSPSIIIASLPVSNACEAENSSPAPAFHLTRFLCP